MAAVFTKLQEKGLAAERDFQAVMADILLYLTSTALQQNDPEDAVRWLPKMDRLFPSMPERIALRWELMELLHQGPFKDLYVDQAKFFLRDPLVRKDTHPAAIWRTIRILYEEVSPFACAGVLASAHGGLSRTPEVRSAFALCHCPATFASVKDADKWHSEISSGNLKFSKQMMADALLVAARAAEWSGDWIKMEGHAKEALLLVPNGESARYWLTRAQLHRPEKVEAPKLDPWPDSSAWQRLRHQINLQREPTLDHAEKCLAVLANHPGSLDLPERELTFQLLERALTLESARTRESIGRCAEISKAVEKTEGRLPWVEVNLALQEIHLHCRYGAAAQRLEAPDILVLNRAPELARLARLLEGSPRPAVFSAEGGCLSVLESACYRVLGENVGDSAQNHYGLLQEIAAARREPLFREFPALDAVAEVLEFALLVFSGVSGVREQLASYELSNHAPLWVRWLLSRVIQLVSTPAAADPLPAKVIVEDPAIAWFVEAWWHHYGADEPPPDAVSKSNSLLEGEISNLAKGQKECARALRWARAQRYRRVEINPIPAYSAQFFKGLGTLCATVCEFEIRLEMAFASARIALSSRKAEEAAGHLQILQAGCARENELVARWWGPLLQYWRGVALAHAGREEAAEVLEKLIGGPKETEARAQLALLAIQRNDLPAAQQWLDNVPLLFPSVLYAQALLAERSNQSEKACRLIESYSARFDSADSQYRVASLRLLAAIHEREARHMEAIKLNGDLLRDFPTDGVAASRLGRLLLRQSYFLFQSGQQITNQALKEEFKRSIIGGTSHIDWFRGYALLYQIFTCPIDELDGTHEKIKKLYGGGDAILPWLQLLVRRQLEAKRPTEAWALLDQEKLPSGPVWWRRTRLILRAWSLCARVWSPSKAPGQEEIATEAERISREPGRQDMVEENWLTAEANLREKAREACLSPKVLEEMAACSREMESIDGNEDPVVNRWRVLLRKAEDLAHAVATDPISAPWGDLSPWLLADLPGLWSADEQQRRRAAEGLAGQVKSEKLEWDDKQSALVGAFTSWVCGKDDEYLSHYAALEGSLGNLPVDGPSLWIAAATIWYRRKNWKHLLQSDLPDCVADLSHPGVRLIIGLAYAQAAADDAIKGDTRSALQRVRQAGSTLEPLLQGKSLSRKG